jgi:hypothetical protein
MTMRKRRIAWITLLTWIFPGVGIFWPLGRLRNF